MLRTTLTVRQWVFFLNVNHLIFYAEVPSAVDPDQVVVLFVGEDQYKLAKAVERTLGFYIQVIPRLSSSTLVRQAIDNEEWDLLTGMIPGSIINDVIQLHLTNA